MATKKASIVRAADGTAKINPALDALARPIDSLKLDDRNARKHERRSIDAIKTSLATYGQQKPIVALASGVIIAGNGTLEAARELGWDRIAVVTFDNDDDARARAFAIMDNRSAELSDWDSAELLAYLQSAPSDLLGSVGFTFQEIDALIRETTPEQEKETTVHPPVFSVDEIVEACFEHYRKTGFPFRGVSRHVAMQELNKLARLDGEQLRRSIVGNQIADTHQRHRFFAKAAMNEKQELLSVFEGFMDDKMLRNIIRVSLENGAKVDGFFGLLNLNSGVQVLSNFRPGFAAWLYRRFAEKGSRILDTSTGYGGRMVGFFAASIDATSYVGIDPNDETTDGNERLAAELGMSDRVRIIRKAAEDVTIDEVGGEESIDFSFTSPPYFCKEHYANDDRQSWVRYKTFDAWCDGFLRPMLSLTFRSLKRGKFAAVNIADVKIGKTVHPLAKMTEEIGVSCGFELHARESFPMANGWGSVSGEDAMPDADVAEPLIIFRKPSA